MTRNGKKTYSIQYTGNIKYLVYDQTGYNEDTYLDFAYVRKYAYQEPTVTVDTETDT